MIQIYLMGVFCRIRFTDKECTMAEEKCCCGHAANERYIDADGVQHKHRDNETYKKLNTRLNRIEGQIRGIHGMLDEERYCVDILTQVMAAQSALASFGRELLEQHIRTCVISDIRAGREESVEELIKLLNKSLK